MRTSRFAFRAVWFAMELMGFLCDFIWRLVRSGFKLSQFERSLWLQRSSRRTLAAFSVVTRYEGSPPEHGLLVSNHLSYLDILVLVSLMPAVFISKSEVKHWPVFGWFAMLAGTLFVDRTKRSDVGRMNKAIERKLDDGNVLVLFPEGTSWDGSKVLPFKSSLLEPIITSKHPLTICRIGYALKDGNAAEDVCYWGDAAFFPHLLKLMTKKQVESSVRFEPVSEFARDRKELARELHAKVSRISV